MRKIKTFFYIFYKSLTSPKYYNDIIKTNTSFSIKYFLVLSLFASVITSLAITATAVPEIQKVTSKVLSEALNTYPSELIITIKDSKLSINQEEPYAIAAPKSMLEGLSSETQDDIKNIVVFDSQGTLNDMDKYQTLILINEANMLVRNQNKIEARPLKSLPDGELTIETLREFIKSLQPIVNLIPIGFAVGLLILMLLYYYVYRAGYLLFVGFLVMVIGRLRGLNTTFSQGFQIALHSMTLPVILGVITMSAKIIVPISLWFFIINLVFAFVAVVQMGSKS